jgi:predicted Zn-dependent peptidase
LPDDYYDGQIERLASVRLDEVHEAATKHVDPGALSIVVVGDRAVVESSLKDLNLPIVYLDYEGEAVG